MINRVIVVGNLDSRFISITGGKQTPKILQLEIATTDPTNKLELVKGYITNPVLIKKVCDNRYFLNSNFCIYSGFLATKIGRNKLNKKTKNTIFMINDITLVAKGSEYLGTTNT